MYGNSGVV